MFERFTTGARRAVTDAQQVAREVGAATVGTTHLAVALATGSDPVEPAGADPTARELAARGADRATLLAHLAPGDGLDAEALGALGIDLAVVRQRAEAAFGAGALERGARRDTPRPHRLPFDADGKKALEVALRETVRLGGRRIEAGHVLLALLRLDGTEGHALLVRCGVDPAELAAVVQRRLTGTAAA